jgi:hypothetical protein
MPTYRGDIVPHRTLERGVHIPKKKRRESGPILRQIFKYRLIEIEEIHHFDTAQESLMNENIFVHIDPSEWRPHVKGKQAKGIHVQLFEVLRNPSNDRALFESLDRNLDDICLTQSQVAKFVRVYGHSAILNDTRSTLFLTRTEEGYHVIEVRSYLRVDKFTPRLLSASVHHTWKLFGGPKRRLQIVVPAPEEQ